MTSSNVSSFGLNFASTVNEESQLHGTMNGGGRPLSSSGTSSTSGSSVAVVPSSMETTSSVTTVSNSPSVGSSPPAKATSYDSHSRLIAGYPRLPGFYGSSYSNEQSTLYPTNTASFYPSLGTHYELDKSTGSSWTPLASQTPYSPYDAHHSFYTPYGNCYGAIDSAARRKNATRETTNTLKAWLYEHRKNPYPTKGEKIMLAIITKMTLTQVSTWFANARRRLKKENKMTWEPKNKSTDARDDSDKESCKNMDDDLSDKANDSGNGLRGSIKEESNEATPAPNSAVTAAAILPKGHLLSNHGLSAPVGPHQQLFAEGDNLDGQRPKIWSLAHTATSEAMRTSTLADRLYPEWYTFQSNNVSDNLLLNSFPEQYHHSHHQANQHVQSTGGNFYSKGHTQAVANGGNHWNEEHHNHIVARNAPNANNGPSGNFGCSTVQFLPEHSSVTGPAVSHHFLLQQHRSQISTS